eukprot:2156097-Pyramimonas_sp.AAC.1
MLMPDIGSMEFSTSVGDISLLEGPQGNRAQAGRPGCRGCGMPDESPMSPSLRKVPAPRQQTSQVDPQSAPEG